MVGNRPTADSSAGRATSAGDGRLTYEPCSAARCRAPPAWPRPTDGTARRSRGRAPAARARRRPPFTSDRAGGEGQSRRTADSMPWSAADADGDRRISSSADGLGHWPPQIGAHTGDATGGRGDATPGTSVTRVRVRSEYGGDASDAGDAVFPPFSSHAPGALQPSRRISFAKGREPD